MRKHLPAIIVCLVVVAFLGGTWLSTIWSRQMIASLTPAVDNAMGRRLIDLLRRRDYVAIEAQIDPTDRNSDVRRNLEKMASLLPSAEPSRVDVVSWWWNAQLGGSKDKQLEYELAYPTKWIYVYIAAEENHGKTVLKAFRVNQLREPLEQINAFTFAHKSPAQYLLLVALVAIGAFVFWTLIESANAFWMRWPIRIVWCLLICIGAGQITMDWTTGEVGVKVLTLYAPAVELASASVYAPWYAMLSFPLGALLFWLRRAVVLRRLDEQERALPTPEAVTSPT